MNNTTKLDHQRYELALGTGLVSGAYTIKEAELVAEQHGLNWERVKFWAGLSNKESEE